METCLDWRKIYTMFPFSVQLLFEFFDMKPKPYAVFEQWCMEQEFYVNPMLLSEFFEQNEININLSTNNDGTFNYLMSTSKETVFSKFIENQKIAETRLLMIAFEMLEDRLNVQPVIFT